MSFNVDQDSCGTSDEAQEEEGSEKSGMASSITGEEEEIGEDDFGSMGNEGCPMQVMEEEEQEDAGSKRGWWLFDTVNANAWGSEETQGRGKGALDYLRRTNADVVGIQETRVTTKEKCATGMGAAKKAKWKTKLVEADVTCKGYSSAGVAVACRSHFGMTDPHVDGIEYDRARIAHGHIGAVCRGGIHCFSVYLHTCEGMTGRKRALLLELSRLVKAVRGPWVVMGDWNLTPDALEAVGWAEEVEGKIVCPLVPTCKGSVIDFIVIDRRLMHAVLYVKRLDNFGLVPHSPVRMALMAEPRKMMVRMLVAPQCVPARLPAGCLTKEQFEAGKEGFEREGGVGPWMNSWMRKAELVWAGIGGKEGKALGRACGRADGPRMVWKSALGPLADKVLFSTVISRSWCKIAGWCTTIKQAREHAVSRDNREHPLARAAGVAQRRIRAAAKWKWKPGAQREALWSFIAAFEEVDIRGDMNKLVAMEAWAVKESEEAARNAAAEATTKFQQWLQEGEAKGIARQHAMSKCPGQWVPGKMVKERAGQDDALAMVLRQWEGVYEENQIGRLVATIQARGAELEVPANIQQEVDVEGAKWAAEWAAGETVEECRWPDDLEELASINAHSIREAAATFADGVGMGRVV